MSNAVVIVGESICGGEDKQKVVGSSDDVFLRGFNTFPGSHPNDLALSREGAGEVIAAVNGYVEVTDRVVSVKGKLPRYLPEIGDVIVGRIAEVAGNKWLVDINASQMAVMLLSNVTEPGGMLRRRGRGDELSMRQLFDQDDLVAAEVQRISPDGVVSLHTRAAEKYGKITGLGQLITVRSALIRRAKHQFVTMPKLSSQLTVGMNGNIWVSWQKTQSDDNVTTNEMRETCDSEGRHNVVRVANCVKVLGAAGIQIHSKSIECAVEASISAGFNPFEVLLPSNREVVTGKLPEVAGIKRPRI